MSPFSIPVSVLEPPRPAVLLTPPRSSHPGRLRSRQHLQCVNPLASALMLLPGSAAHQRRAEWLSPLAATLTKNTGFLLQAKSFPPSFSRCSLQLLLSVP